MNKMNIEERISTLEGRLLGHDSFAMGQSGGEEGEEAGGEERMSRIRRIIRYQFDLEILNKWREIRIIEEEIERGQQLQMWLEKLVLNGNCARV